MRMPFVIVLKRWPTGRASTVGILNGGRRNERPLLQAVGANGDDPVAPAGQPVAGRAVDVEALLAALQEALGDLHRETSR